MGQKSTINDNLEGKPSLRFDEFRDEWAQRHLGDLVSFSRGGPLSKEDLVIGGKYKAVHYGQLFTEYNEVINVVKSLTNTDTGKRSRSGDILMPTSDVTPQGLARASAIHEEGVMLGGDINILTPKESTNSDFLSYLLNYQKKKIMRLVTGITVRHIYASDIQNISYYSPSLPEQQKIASFLTTVDTRIEKLEQKITLLKAYKKGAMQRIFSQQIRFKSENGEEYAAWEEKRLGDFLTERNEQYPKSKEYPLMAFVAYKGVAAKGDRFNREFLVNKSEVKKYKRTEFGDFIYSSNNLETGSIGLNLYGPASISPVYSIFRIDDTCDALFTGALLLRKKIVYEMTRYRQGVVYGQWRIHESDFLKIKDMIPSLPEQRKISTFLSSIDQKITSEESKLQGLKKFKKSLLQKMFV